MGCGSSTRIMYEAVTGEIDKIHSDYSCDIRTKYGDIYRFAFWSELTVKRGEERRLARLEEMDHKIRHLLELSLIGRYVTIIATHHSDPDGDLRILAGDSKNRWVNVHNEVDDRTRPHLHFLAEYLDARASKSQEKGHSLYVPPVKGSMLKRTTLRVPHVVVNKKSAA